MKLQNVLSGLDARYVEFGEIADLAEPANIFLNVNGPEDYKTAVKIVGG
jgi:molybdopterin-guanine dinucleotide biosynthesis protein A